ncbi:MAG TPA: carboxymuconolactone decarboxylase family protein [Solirubrobacteraceae bacterium]|nr:carboxymuconolactone decarboxylase family protein [Solirubrobacteraceae bacterium]
MARLPYPDPDSSPEPVREALAALPSLNIFRMLSHAQTAFRPFLRFGGAILGRLELDPKLRELAILQVAADAGAKYEWVQHASIARQVGVPEEQIAAVEAGRLRDPSLGDGERAVLNFAREVVAVPRVSDATFASVSELLSPREIVELLLTVGNYLMLARVMTTLELELDDPAGEQVLGSSERS